MDKQNIKLTEKRLLNMTEFQAYTSVGRNSAMKLAHESGTEVRIGRQVLVDRVKFDEWCDQYL